MLKQPTKWLGRFALVGLVGLLVTSLLPAQTQFTGLRGDVTDQSDLPVPGADIVATNEATGLKRSTITNDFGQYELRALVSGTYTVVVEMSGFKKYINRGVIVYSAEVRRVDVRLEVGDLAESVTVEEVGATIGTDKSEVSYKMPYKEVNSFDLGGDMIYQVFENPGFERRSQVHGGYANNLTVTNDNIATNAYGQFRVATETVAEINQVSINAPAEYRTATSVMGIGRSGSNRFHGEIYVHVIQPRLNALPRGVERRPPSVSQRQWNYEASGPVYLPGIYDGRNKSFFAFNHRRQRGTSTAFNLGYVLPTSKMRTGDISEYYDAVVIPRLAQGGSDLTNPFTGERFPNNAEGVCCQIPTELMSPIALNVLDLLPQVKRERLTDNFDWVGQNHRFYDEWYWRGDHQITDNNNFTIAYYDIGLDSVEGTSSPFLNDFASFQTPGEGLSISDSHTHSANTVNEFSFSYSSQVNIWSAGDVVGRDFLKDLVGITDVGGRTVRGGPGSPKIRLETLGRGADPALSNPQDIISGAVGWMSGDFDFTEASVTQIRDNVSHAVGPHLLKMGLEVRHQFPHRFITAGDNWGRFDFNGIFTGYDYADFILGLPFTTAWDGDPPRTDARQNEVGFFIQDDWKARDDLTLSLGLRFQHYGVPTEREDEWYSFDLDRMMPVVPTEQVRAGVNPAFPIPILTASEAGYPRNLVNFKFLLVDPRIGIAWRPSENTVVRVGYGMYHVPYAHPTALASNLTGDLFTRAGLLAGRVDGPFRLREEFGPNRIVNGVPELSLSSGFPAPGTGSSPLVSMVSMPPNLRAEKWPLDQQWNLTVEREMGMGFATRISYVGARGLWWPFFRNLQIPPASATPFGPERRPFGPDQFSSIFLMELGATSTHHGLEIESTRQFSSGLYLRAWFSWLKTLNDVVGGLFASTTGRELEDPYDRARDKGMQTEFTPLKGRLAAIWEVPYGRRQRYGTDLPGILQHVLGNWTAAPLIYWGAGDRRHATFSGADPANVGRGGGRADQLCDATSGTDSGTQWNRSCFAIPPNGRYGNSPRGVLPGPRSWRTRLNVFKKWYLMGGDQLGPYFEVDAYIQNPLNHSGKRCCDSSNITSPNFGILRTNQNDIRQIQIRLRLGF